MHLCNAPLKKVLVLIKKPCNVLCEQCVSTIWLTHPNRQHTHTHTDTEHITMLAIPPPQVWVPDTEHITMLAIPPRCGYPHTHSRVTLPHRQEFRLKTWDGQHSLFMHSQQVRLLSTCYQTLHRHAHTEKHVANCSSHPCHIIHTSEWNGSIATKKPNSSVSEHTHHAHTNTLTMHIQTHSPCTYKHAHHAHTNTHTMHTQTHTPCTYKHTHTWYTYTNSLLKRHDNVMSSAYCNHRL